MLNASVEQVSKDGSTDVITLIEMISLMCRDLIRENPQDVTNSLE